MATITARKRSDGTTAYTAQIRLKQGGKVVHSEARTFAKRATARAWAAEREEQIRRDPSSATRAEHLGVTVGDLVRRYIDERQAVEPLGRSKHQHLRLMTTFEIAQAGAVSLTAQQLVDHVMRRRKSGTGASTVKNDLVWLRVVWRYARAAWGIPVNPQVLADASELAHAERLVARSGKRSRLPTADELRRIEAWFNRPRLSAGPEAPMALVMWFLIYSCRRLGEACRMRLSDLDRERRTWLVRDLKHPGGSSGRHREMLVSDRLLTVVDAILALPGRDPGEDRVLPYQEKTIGTYWTRQLKLLGIEDLHLHDLRHEGCTRLAEDGWTIPQIQQVSLHEAWSTLQVYVDLRVRPGRVEFGG